MVLFLSGSCFSVYIGVDSLLTPHDPAEVKVALGTMALSAAVETTTLWIAYKSVAKAAKKMSMSVGEYVKHGPDQTAVSVMAQDIVSVSALLWATVALSVSSATGNAAFDALGSIGVGLGLGWLAYYLGFRNIALLNGHSIPSNQIRALEKMLNSDAVVDKAYNLKADYLGPGNVAVSADIDFEGREITRRYIERETSLEYLAKWKPGMLLAEVCGFYHTRNATCNWLMSQLARWCISTELVSRNSDLDCARASFGHRVRKVGLNLDLDIRCARALSFLPFSARRGFHQ